MKKTTLVRLTLSIFALVSCLPTLAQTTVTFTMSSSFYAGNSKLPAGTYLLRQMQGEPDVQILQNKAGTHSVMLDCRSSSKTSSGKAELAFNRYGTTDYLEGLVTSNGTSVDFPVSTAEKIAAKKDTAQPHTVSSQ
jgi:hypothetical protein